MNTDGYVVDAVNEQEAARKFLEMGVDHSQIAMVDGEVMTRDQQNRMANNEQPVVKPHDHRSEAGKILQEMRRRGKLARDQKMKNRRKRKAAKASRRKNRR